MPDRIFEKLQSQCMKQMEDKMLREEARVREFVRRTKLPLSEITMAVLPSGNAYPQWTGALRDMAPGAPED